jgi:hypothetical protein
MGDRAQEEQQGSRAQDQDAVAASTGGGGTLRDTQRKAGAAAVARIATDGGRPVDDPEKLAQQSLWSADASVTDVQGEELYRDGHTVVSILPGTRLSVAFDQGGLSIQAQPGFNVVNIGPTTQVTSVRYDFATAQFQSVGSAHYDLFGMWAHVVRGKLESALDAKFRPLLPPALAKPGYQPSLDPDLQGTIQGLSKIFAVDGGDQAGGGAAAAGGGASRFVDPSAWAQLFAPEELHVPLGTDELEMFLAKGTAIGISADASGAVTKPHLKQLVIRSSNPGIAIRSTGKGVLDSLKGLTMQSVTISPGGRFAFDYQLDVEAMGDGFKALVALFGMAAGENVDTSSIKATKLQSVRKELDARLQQEVPPAFRAFLQQFDKALPGFSLMDIFGVGNS